MFNIKYIFFLFYNYFLSGYLNEKGTLNLARFQKFMETLANFDYDQFRDTFADIKFLEGKRSANIPTTNKVCLFYGLFFILNV